MKKINRQVTRVSRPPTTGPEEAATAPPIAHTATARARLAGSGNAWPISAIDAGIITAAAAPCPNRATMSAPRLGARPQAAEAATNTPSPAANARRAPTRSVSAPADSSSAANISVYPSTTHCSPVMPPPRSPRIEGRATLTTTASRVITKKPSTAAARVNPELESRRVPGLTGCRAAATKVGAQLARACRVTQQSMASMLTGLQNKGLIDRQPSPVHAKVLIATLTDAGRDLLDGAYREVIVLERALTDRFTPAEHQQFCEFLDRATVTLIEQTPSAHASR
jgi:DNA-binding MarR family transcriptional regulator